MSAHSIFHCQVLRVLTPVLAASALSLGACGLFGFDRLHSDLTVPARETFILGGDQAGSFTATAKNVGSVSVTIAQREKSGKITELGALAPGQKQKLTIQAGRAALVRNTTSQTARLSIDVTGRVPGIMGYEKTLP